MESDDEDLLCEQGASKASYATEIVDISDDEEEDQCQRGPDRCSAAAHVEHALRPSAHPASTATSTAAAAASARVLNDSPKIADAFGAESVERMEEDEEEDDEDEEDEADDDDDEELGGSEGDTQFQAMLQRMEQAAEQAQAANGGSGGSAPEADLLSQILKGGTSAWKGSSRTHEGESQDKEENAHARGSVGEEEVDYQIYCDQLLEPAQNGDVITQLAALRMAILQFMEPSTADYIWQKEAMQLQVCAPAVHTLTAAGATSGSASAAPPSRAVFSSKHASTHSTLLSHLHGTCHFGDNIEDEW